VGKLSNEAASMFTVQVLDQEVRTNGAIDVISRLK